MTVAQVRRILEEKAKAGDTITYAKLDDLLGLPVRRDSSDNKILTEALFQISRQDQAAKRPLLAAIVVRGNLKTVELRVPSEGFFVTLCRYRGIERPADINERRSLHQDELQKVRRYYAANQGESAGNLCDPD